MYRIRLSSKVLAAGEDAIRTELRSWCTGVVEGGVGGSEREKGAADRALVVSRPYSEWAFAGYDSIRLLIFVHGAQIKTKNTRVPQLIFRDGLARDRVFYVFETTAT